MFYMAILAGPCLAAILLTGIVDGRPGLRELLARLLTRLFSWLPPFRVLLVWVYDRTQSLPVVMFNRYLTFSSNLKVESGEVRSKYARSASNVRSVRFQPDDEACKLQIQSSVRPYRTGIESAATDGG